MELQVRCASGAPLQPSGANGGSQSRSESQGPNEDSLDVDGTDKREIALKNLKAAKNKVIKGLRDGSLKEMIGLSEDEVLQGFNGKSGFDGIKFELVDDLEGATARVAFRERDLHGLSDMAVDYVTIKVRVDRASTLGGAVEAVAHEFRHLSFSNRLMSDVVQPGQDFSPMETDARSVGADVREFYGL